MIYCAASKRKARIRWNFPDRNSPQELIVRSPVSITVNNIPNPDEDPPVYLSQGRTTHLISSDYYEGILADNLPENRAYFLTAFTAIGVTHLTIGSRQFRPPSEWEYHLNSRLFIRNKDQFQLYRRAGSAYMRLFWNIYEITTNLWEIAIAHPDGYLAFTGGSKPVYSVDCGDGCPPGTIDCGGCCADCGEISSKLRAIHGRL
jgi:hypothetical protein